jgi:hypothetical protein
MTDEMMSLHTLPEKSADADLLKDNAQRRRMGQAARVRALELFTSSQIVEQLRHCIQSNVSAPIIGRNPRYLHTVRPVARPQTDMWSSSEPGSPLRAFRPCRNRPPGACHNCNSKENFRNGRLSTTRRKPENFRDRNCRS